MSPEQVEGQPLEHRADIFSFGVMLHEMATGKRPLHGESSAARASAILRDSPAAVSEVREALPRHRGRIVSPFIEKDPRGRYQAARDDGEGLRVLRREVGVDSSVLAAAPEAAPAPRPGTDTDPRSDVSPKPRITVLLLTTTSSDRGPDEIADGLSEDVATGRSRFAVRFVVVQRATRRLEAETTDVREIDEELNARSFLAGNVSKSP